MDEKTIARKVDELGRIVLPREFREKLGIEEKDELKVSTQNGKIILEKKK